jgi:PD-(D/E)XK nuclease superfamily protein
MEKQRPEIIRDNKKRGEWAESVFAARAAENGLPVSKPSGDSTSFDYVVGHPGKFVAVQVKCTIARLPNGKGYRCNLQSNNKRYPPGAFDFVAAYVVPEDAWYIVPMKAIGGQSNLSLCTVGTWAKFEEYREAWDLLRKATGCEESHVSQGAGEMGRPPVSDPEERPMGPGVARMQAAMNSFRGYLEKGGRAPR